MSRKQPRDHVGLGSLVANTATTLAVVALLVGLVLSALTGSVGSAERAGQLARRAVVNPVVREALVDRVVGTIEEQAGTTGNDAVHGQLQAVAEEVLQGPEVAALAQRTGEALWSVHVGEETTQDVDLTPVLVIITERVHEVAPGVSLPVPTTLSFSVHGDGVLRSAWHTAHTVGRLALWAAALLFALALAVGPGTVGRRLRRIGVLVVVLATLVALAAHYVVELHPRGWLAVPGAVVITVVHGLWRPSLTAAGIGLALLALGAVLGVPGRLRTTLGR